MSRTQTSLAPTDLQRQYHTITRKNGITTSLSMAFVILMAMYFLLPLYWLLVSTTKTTSELFNTPMLVPANHLGANLRWLATYQNGEFWRWVVNSAVYSFVAAAAGTLISAMAGYALAKYRFRGQRVVSTAVLGSLMVPAAALTIPIFLLEKSMGLINTYIGVILPMLVNPFGVYFMSVYIREAMPTELMDSGRVDGASDYGVFFRIALAILRPGLVTLFLIIFIGTWNNFFLPLVLLSKSSLYPLPVGLEIWTANLNSAGTGQPLYPLILIGSLLSILPMLILFPLLRKYIISGIAAGSIKS
ncbi:MAG: carbohydrate ABC transporter permease [Alicyclobacillus herbarius]|uniref:carbohydrate ABC transporter permease n=1 Tax=Alicyclobacillus herbarius TaxID=122960 RepID=UPI00235710FB|nr:carbohydrate ABC transporter permease [Alicyclobacillus herbarius]MCL6631324.1 carbohydrate ABC transporter permease [Alicyclobacillus herbarius]